MIIQFCIDNSIMNCLYCAQCQTPCTLFAAPGAQHSVCVLFPCVHNKHAKAAIMQHQAVFDQLQLFLAHGEKDVFFDNPFIGITITDERKKAIDFSDGYYKSGLLVMVKADNNDVKSVKDLDGKVVAVKSGTGSVDYAKANIKTKDLRQFPNIDNAYMELGTGRADAVLHDTPNILYFIKTAGNGKFKAVGESLEAQNYGIAFPKGSDELREKVNGALKTLRENGTYNEIYKKWFGTEPK